MKVNLRKIVKLSNQPTMVDKVSWLLYSGLLIPEKKKEVLVLYEMMERLSRVYFLAEQEKLRQEKLKKG